ncbi:MAG: hypothetical protein J3K34DRAFT_527410 [Monoraphidium minutum]|nr:MAG: hypothetical protein J3K34DRAFT_527410 [Monoraphidium minutum]
MAPGAAAAGAAAAAAARYGDPGFWRGSAPQSLDHAITEWYADFAALKPLFLKTLSFGDSLLLVGPGQSALHEQLYDSGFRGLTVVDAAEEVLAPWRARSEAEGRGVKFEVADVAEGLHTYAHYSYHAAVDKGTLDCLLCRNDGERSARAALRNLHGALRSPGTLVVVSHSPSDARLALLRCCEWESIQVKVVSPPGLADAAAGRAAAAIMDFCADEAQGSLQADGAVCSYVYICRKPY